MRETGVFICSSHGRRDVLDRLFPSVFKHGTDCPIWDKGHLLAMLGAPGSIWDFEHQKLDRARHFAVASDPPVRFRHLVEKGRWQPYAKRLLRSVNDLSSWQVWPNWAYGRV
jgi:hypothetical protein